MCLDDKQELERLASDNSAMTIPASQTVSRGKLQRQVSNRQVVKSSNPSGEQGTVIEKPPQQLTKYDVGWRRVVRNFSPSWFSATMGTGIVSILLITIPFKSRWLYWISVFFFVLNMLLFSVAFLTSVLRYTLYPEIWFVMIADETNSLFLGTIPIGFATLVECWIFLCVPYLEAWSITFAWACWMIDCVVAAAVTVSLTVLLISKSHQQPLHRITAAQLLPIAATVVAAGTGAEVAEVLQNPDHALGTLIASYVMWGMATPLAMAVLVMYYQRLALHKLPPREVVVSSFLPLGPLGMGGYTIMYLGKVSRKVFPRVEFFHNLVIAGDVVYILGVFVALIMWGFGLMWLAFALATIYKSRPFPFNMGWWGFTFPLGVFAVSTIEFGVEMPSLFFRVLGTIFSVAVIILWMVVAVGTAKGAWNGRLFYAPCLANLKKEERQPKGVEDKEKEASK
jgi:tellurite resistance protein TehA-like permease